ncbi:MAG: Hsp70 family protein [Oscillospiraceae bacterium]|nr:Hsp70 family protein [Oscillospiraceae bacterium]
MKIGVDFGSTYSTFAAYDEVTDQPSILSMEEGRPATLPTMVSRSMKNGEWNFGNGAKDLVGNKKQQIFEAFKMLLVEENQSVIQRRGYSEEHTPRAVSQRFLHSVLDKIRDRYGEDLTDVVVCVPEIWGSKMGKALDGRAILKDILTTEADGSSADRRVRVVTEPEAASAFFAYNYEKKTEAAFNGHLLLIDYGGGTLDLTLTKVSSDGKGIMEISYCASGGVGENHTDIHGNNTIGNAGIAFMQDVVIRAMKEQGYLEEGEEINYTDPAFLRAVKELESKLVNRSADIQFNFGKFGSYHHVKKILNRDPISFTDLDYGDDGLEITYQHIFRSYQDVIEKVLDQETKTINEKVEAAIGMDPCSPEAGTVGNFKIAVVGGFGSFYLVKHQIDYIYGIDPDEENDLRLRDIDGDKKETAIALGASLIASDRVTLQRIARYSIGVRAVRQDGTRVASYGINVHQIVTNGVIYPICRENSDTPTIYANIKGQITSFVINFTGLPKQGIPMRLKEEMIAALNQGLDAGAEGLWTCGFSMDESNIISFHAIPYTMHYTDNRQEIMIPLASYTNLFEAMETNEEDFI